MLDWRFNDGCVRQTTGEARHNEEHSIGGARPPKKIRRVGKTWGGQGDAIDADGTVQRVGYRNRRPHTVWM